MYTSKIKLSDTIWAISSQDIIRYDICDFCDAEGDIVGKDRSHLPCPKCKGKTKFETGVDFQWDIFRKFVVKEILIHIKLNELGETITSIVYKYADKTFPENQCFLSEEEAKRECEKLNNAFIYN